MDGRTSESRPVQVRLSPPDTLWLDGLGTTRRFTLDQVQIGDRLGTMPRSFTLPDGARLEIDDNDRVDAALAEIGYFSRMTLVARLEGRYRWVVIATLVTLAILGPSVAYGIPWLSRQVAERLPPETDRYISSNGLRFMDQGLLDPTDLTPLEQRRMERLFAQVTQDTDPRFTFELALRSSKQMEANAFALPGGTIVVLDDLVALAQSDDEILAVLAHEAGHVIHRHTLRQILQASAISLLLSAITADVGSAMNIAVALPTILVDSSYSRAFENEADSYAGKWMAEQDKDPLALTRLLARMENASNDKDGNENSAQSGLSNYLSSHPSTSAREQALEQLTD